MTRVFIMLLYFACCSCGGRAMTARNPDRAFDNVQEGVYDEGGKKIEGYTESGSDMEEAPVDVPSYDRDHDNDGIVDYKDACPDDPEDYDNFEDDDGCPEPDNDGDTIPDGEDSCPNEPETYNGKDDQDGCPDTSDIVVIICPPKPIPTYVYYNKKKLNIKEAGHDFLDAVAKIIIDHPKILRVQVAAYSDSKGSKSSNIKTTQKVAGKAVDYLVARGVDKTILSAAGYGGGFPVQPQGQGQ